MLNNENHIEIHNSDNLRSILGSLCYLEKEAKQAHLASVRKIISDAIRKITDDSTTNKELHSDNFVPIIEFFTLVKKLDTNDITEIIKAVTDTRNKAHDASRSH